jgi:hypothetical protein
LAGASALFFSGFSPAVGCASLAVLACSSGAGFGSSTATAVAIAGTGASLGVLSGLCASATAGVTLLGALATGSTGFVATPTSALAAFAGAGAGFESPQAARVNNRRMGACFMCVAAEGRPRRRTIPDSENRRDAGHVDDVVALASA